ncbi:MAG: glycosyltransferase [Actinobacteria bacterium]|nr:glycosyltransferase [Actinomycetota bacterium]
MGTRTAETVSGLPEPVVAPQSYLLVAGSRDALLEHREAVAALRSIGHEVRWAQLGAVPKVVRETLADDLFHGLTIQATSSPARRVALGAASISSSPARRMRLAARFDPWWRRAVRRSDHVIALDQVGDAALPVALDFDPQVTTLPAVQAPEALAQYLAWARFVRAAVPAGQEGLAPHAARLDRWTTAAAGVQNLSRPAWLQQDAAVAVVRAALTALSGERRHRDALRLATAAAAVPWIGTDPGVRAQRVLAELDDTARTDADPAATAGLALGLADTALARGDRDETVRWAVTGLQIAFHRELHSDVASSPLIDDPRAYLAPLRQHRVWGLLTDPVPRSPADETGSGDAAPRMRVVVLPGAYGSFYEPVVQALRELSGTQVKVLPAPGRRRELHGMVVTASPVALRLAAGLGETAGALADVGLQRPQADALFVDWADKMAVWAVLAAAPGTRITVRVHSVDALRPWLHLIDWSRVDELVCVSPHLLDLVRDALGPALQHTHAQVVPNIVEVARFERPRQAHQGITLGLVGWAQKVKDPLWAVEVLAGLLAAGGDWRLILIGPDFPDNPTASGRVYADRFRQRAMAEDVRDRIIYAGQVSDPSVALAEVDVVLSASVRESWHLGMTEGVAAGAVPVVRNWPAFARRGGAGRLYPPDWVVDSAQQAVERIRLLADPVVRQQESGRARQALLKMAEPGRVGRAYREVVVGRQARLADLTTAGQHTEALELARRVLADDAPGAMVLQQAARTSRAAGELTLQVRLLQRQSTLYPTPHAERLLRREVGGLTELAPWWYPRVHQPLSQVTGGPAPWRVLHLLKISMPYRQSGYALRSRYLLDQQHLGGWDPVAVTALDFPRTLRLEPEATRELVGQVPHVRLLREQIPAAEPFDQHLDAFAGALIEVVATERAQIIHVHSGHRGYENALVALSVGRALKRPVVYEVRGMFEAVWTTDASRAENAEIYRLRRATEERCMRAANAVVTLSESMRQDILSRGIAPSKVFVVPNGIAAGDFSPRPRSADVSARLGLAPEDFVFGYVSNLDHFREGQELLIDAAVILRDRGVPARALIVGDGRRRGQLQRHAENCSAGDAVLFTGRVEHEEVAEYYAQLDVFVVPRVDERAARLTTPLKPYEAMALGVPVVVSELPALREIIGAGERGCSFPPGDAAALADILGDLAADPRRRADMAHAAREWVLAHRTWAANAARYEAVYAAVQGEVPDWPDSTLPPVEPCPDRADDRTSAGDR